MDRLGGDDKSPGGADAPLSNVPMDTTSQPLSFSVPTEHVELPSGGKYYPENHPLHNAETIEIKYMTAKEEDILTSPSLLKKGLTIERLLRSIILDKSIDPQNLLSGDRNAILVAARITGYGEEYAAKLTCPSCYTPNDWAVDLSAVMDSSRTTFEDSPYNITANEDGTFVINLPKTDLNVTVKLLTGRDEKMIASAIEKRKKHKLDESQLTEQLKQMIVAVNGRENPAEIDQFINFVPAFDSKYLRNAYAALVPNINMKHDFTCSACDYNDEVEVPLTAEFFWPK
tara:strand:+ start:539 stop:1396 length:858 start_codon:yes stop_codon:yes gene_type:complete